MHAVLAFLLALEQREADGEGRLVEVTMVEAALNAAAEQVVEHGAYGVCLGRDGNHGPSAAPQNVYRCAGEEQWIALAVESDAQWDALRAVMGDPPWSREPSLATGPGRRTAEHLLDDELARWCEGHDVEPLVERLVAAGVPAAVVIHPRDVSKNPRLRARGFFEALDHDVVGRHELPALPFRFASRGDAGWLRRPAPTVGQHNDEVLGGLLGLDDGERARLREDRIVGERPLGL
jgi:crotonobetainyl-CoA:carnitine CoA-transferase CaiB-like acyl-CoA transferase